MTTTDNGGVMTTATERVWGLKGSQMGDKEIKPIAEWKAEGGKMAVDLMQNVNGNLYVKMVAPDGTVGSAYFSNAIQALMQEAGLKGATKEEVKAAKEAAVEKAKASGKKWQDEYRHPGDKIRNLIEVVAVHVAYNDDDSIKDLYIGAPSGGGVDDWA